jgi:hypothetical protein
VVFVNELHPGDGSGCGHGERAKPRRMVRPHFPELVQVHVLAGSQRRGFPVIVCVDCAIGRPDDEKPAAAEIAS